MGKQYSLEQGSVDDHIMNLIEICGGVSPCRSDQGDDHHGLKTDGGEG